MIFGHSLDQGLFMWILDIQNSVSPSFERAGVACILDTGENSVFLGCFSMEGISVMTWGEYSGGLALR